MGKYLRVCLGIRVLDIYEGWRVVRVGVVVVDERGRVSFVLVEESCYGWEGGSVGLGGGE